MSCCEIWSRSFRAVSRKVSSSRIFSIISRSLCFILRRFWSCFRILFFTLAISSSDLFFDFVTRLSSSARNSFTEVSSCFCIHACCCAFIVRVKLLRNSMVYFIRIVGQSLKKQVYQAQLQGRAGSRQTLCDMFV